MKKEWEKDKFKRLQVKEKLKTNKCLHEDNQKKVGDWERTFRERKNYKNQEGL